MIFLLVGMIIGYLGANYRQQRNQPIIGMDKLEIFSTASATIEGQISSINNGVATVRSLSGQEGNYRVSDTVGVFILRPGTKQATSSANLNDDLLNKDAIFSLSYQNGLFEIVSVSFKGDMAATATPAASVTK